MMLRYCLGLMGCLLLAGMVRAGEVEACLAAKADWTARVQQLLKERTADTYDKLELEALNALPALQAPDVSLQSAWPASRVAVAVSGQPCTGGALQRQVLWFRAKAWREGWIYGRAGRADTALAETEPRRGQIDMAQLQLSAADLLAAPAGEFLAKSVSAGAPLRRSDLKTAPLVSRNADVVVVVQGAGLMIRTRGTAMQYGAEGDWIPVMVSGAHKSTRARVVAPGMVYVEI